MAKLPGISYSTNVASLGRHDVHAPGRVATARAAAADQVVTSFQSIEKVLAVSEYTKNIGKAKTDIVDLYDQVTAKELFHVDDIPDYVDFEAFETGLDEQGNVIDIEREFIPAIEINEEWFKRGAKNISEAITSNLITGIARKRLDLEINGSISPAAYGNLVAHNRAVERKEKLAELDYALQAHIIAGDRIGAELVLTRYLASGLITKEDYRIRQLTTSQDLDIEAYSKNIAQAEGTWAIDEIEDELNLNRSITTPGEVESDLTFAQRRSIRTSISARRTQFDKERNERHTETAQQFTGMAIDGVLHESMISEAVRNDNLDDPTARALTNMIQDSLTSASASIVRSGIVAAHKAILQRDIYFPVFGVQSSDMVQESKSNIIRNDVLNGAEKDLLLTYTDKLERALRTTPEFATAVKSIRAAVGLPEGEDAYDTLSMAIMTPTTKLAMKANADFQQALFNYIDEFGAEANVTEFVERNKKVYDYITNPDELDRKWTQLANSPYAAYTPPGPIRNPDYVMKSAYDDWKVGKRSEEDLFDIWNIMYGDAVDLPFLKGL